MNVVDSFYEAQALFGSFGCVEANPMIDRGCSDCHAPGTNTPV